MLYFRDMRPGDEGAVLALVMRVFDEYVGPDFSDEGLAEFERSARGFVLEHPEGHEITVAESDGRLLGMVDLRDCSHVCLFFVDASWQRQGIGRGLLSAALSRHPEVDAVTVNAGPSAVPAYLSLGFTPLAPEVEVNGIRSVAMMLTARG